MSTKPEYIVLMPVLVVIKKGDFCFFSLKNKDMMGFGSRKKGWCNSIFSLLLSDVEERPKEGNNRTSSYLYLI